MSNFKTCFTKVLSVNSHPNPEVHSLEIATVYDYNIVIRKGSMSGGDTVFYIPIDSVLPSSLELLIFPPDGKVKLNKSRVKQIRLQKYPSLGLLVTPSTIQDYATIENFVLDVMLEKDISKDLGIVKYEPPVPSFQTGLPITSKKRLSEHPAFHPYKGLVNIKWGSPFEETEKVHVQLKLHGSNVRAAILAKKPKNILEKVLKFFNLLPDYEFRYGSNNVDITLKSDKNSGFYGTDIYGSALKEGNIQSKLKPNELVYGEVIGEGIQKGYNYGHKKPFFILFDVKVFSDSKDVKGRWLSPEEVQAFSKERGIPMVPTLFEGNYDKEFIQTLVTGKDDYFPKHTKEGIVIKSVANYNDPLSEAGKKARKIINPEYLDKDQSDFH